MSIRKMLKQRSVRYKKCELSRIVRDGLKRIDLIFDEAQTRLNVLKASMTNPSPL